MNRPRFTVRKYRDKYINLYALKILNQTIAQIEERKGKILIYPLIKDMLFIHKGKLKNPPREE